MDPIGSQLNFSQWNQCLHKLR